MTVKEILDASKEKMSKSVAVYQNEMTSLRAGRANPRLLDRIMVITTARPRLCRRLATSTCRKHA